MIREPAWDQLNAGDDDGPHEPCPVCSPECVECGEPTDNTKDGKPCCPECDLPRHANCDEDPCDNCNPWSGTRPW